MRRRYHRWLLPVLAISLLLIPPGGGVALAASGQRAAAADAGSSMAEVLIDLNESLKSENETLRTLNAVLKAENEALKQENEVLRSQLEAAARRIQELEAAAGPSTVEGLFAQLRTRVFRVDVFDYGGRLIGTGSAVAVTENSAITNYHVVEKAWSAELVTESGERIPVAGLTAFSEAWDLAVLQVRGRLQPVTIRTSPARVGEDVVAIGSPVGLINTVSTGIVSARRTMDGLDVIQVSAPISQGSSGGGLFDRQGLLVGVTFAYLKDGQNLNFAIPAEYGRQMLAQAGPLRDLPGVSRLTPENLVPVLYETHPALRLGEAEILLDYLLVPDSSAGYGQAPDVLWMVMDDEAYFDFLTAMLLSDDVAASEAAVQAFVQEVAFLFGKAYPGLDGTVFLAYIGEYSYRPWGYDYVRYNPNTGTWLVIRPVLVYWREQGVWEPMWIE